VTKPYNGGKPTFHEFLTPIGLFVHLYHDKPQLKTSDQHGKVPDIDKETGVQRAEFKVTMAWPKTMIQGELGTMAALAHQVKAEAWPESQPTPQNPTPFFALEPFFRDGDNPAHNTKAREYLFGKYYLNFKQKAEIVPLNPNAPVGPNNYKYVGAPGLIGPYNNDIMALDVYPGCTGRVSGIIFGTEYMGKHFIITRLNNVQLYETPQDNPNLQRIGGGARPDAKSQFDTLKQGNAGGNPLAGLL